MRAPARALSVSGAVGLVVAVTGCLPTYTFADAGEPDATTDGAYAGGADAAGDTSPSSQADAAVDATGEDAGPADATAESPADANAEAAPADAALSDAAGDALADATADATLPDASTAPVDGGTDGSAAVGTVATVGSKVLSTGFGYQLHTVYAENDGRYWVFYVDDATGVIRARASADLVTWSDTSLSLGTGNALADGSDFSVTYANLGGTDVVHVVANTQMASAIQYATLHLRATISGGSLTQTQTVTLPDTTGNGAAGSSAGSCPQAGPATVVSADGHVYDVTAWTGHPSTTCDTNVYRSSGSDVGTSWSGTSFAHDGYYVSVPTFAFSHDLVSLPGAGVVMAVWPDEDNSAETLFDSFGWDLSSSFDGAGGPGSSGTFPTASNEVFYGAGTVASYDDWALCRLSDTDVHLVRHVVSAGGSALDAFEEARFDGAHWQVQASVPPAARGLSNTGVVLLSDPDPTHGMLLVTIGLDDALDIARWRPATGWTQLPSVPGSAQRQSLAGSGCGNARPRVLWTEGSSAPYVIREADLSALLAP
jgi:hypothetical protein